MSSKFHPKHHLIATAVVGLSALALQGCSSYSNTDSKINYKSETPAQVKTLDVPPDLTQLTKESRYNIPGTTVSASSYNNTGAAQTSPNATVAVKQLNDVHVMRDRDVRWLHVDRPAEAIWPVVHEFWIQNGFAYTEDKPQIGVLETDWAENRAKIPMDFIRRTIGKVIDNAYSSGERDKFRTRIERNDAGGVDIFITHRGLSEEYADSSKTSTVWKARPRDTDLEAEMLARLMVQLGGASLTPETAKTAITQAPAVVASNADLLNPNDLAVKNSFDVAWRRVGVSLDRNGFTVEDRDRSQGLYFVRYVKLSDKEEPGFFSRLFSSDKPVDHDPKKFRIVLKATNGVTHVTIQDSDGKPSTGDIAQTILKLLQNDLK